MRNNIRKSLLIAVAIICLAAGNAMAGTGIGLRLGLSNGEVSQYHVGAHYVSPNFFKHFFFRPAVALNRGTQSGNAGVADVKLQLITYNLDIAWRFLENNSNWSVYVGGGPGLVNAKGSYLYTSGGGGSIGGFGSNTRSANLDPGNNWGYSIVTGVEHKKGFMVEIRKGMYACPSQMFTLGYTF